MNNKEQVRALLHSIETGDHAPVGDINPDKYIQHNLGGRRTASPASAP